MPCPADKHIPGLGRSQLVAMLKAKWEEADRAHEEVRELSVFVLSVHAGHCAASDGVVNALDLDRVRRANRGQKDG